MMGQCRGVITFLNWGSFELDMCIHCMFMLAVLKVAFRLPFCIKEYSPYFSKCMLIEPLHHSSSCLIGFCTLHRRGHLGHTIHIPSLMTKVASYYCYAALIHLLSLSVVSLYANATQTY